MHSGIRVHLTLRGCNSLYIYPIGTKCTPNAFFLHAEDGKNIFVSLLHCDGGKLVTPPPPLRRLNDSGLRVSGGLSLLRCVFAVRSQTRSPCRCRFVWRLATRSWFFSKKATMERVQNEVCSGTISRRRTRSGRSQYFYILRVPPPPPSKAWVTLIPEWPLFRNALYTASGGACALVSVATPCKSSVHATVY